MDGNSQLYVIPELTTTFQQWMNLKTSFIGDKIFPAVPVPSEMFYVWFADKSHLTIPSSTARMGTAKAPMVKYGNKTQLRGPLTEHALSGFITEREYKVASAALNVENRMVEKIAGQMALVDENQLATLLSDTTQLTHFTTLSGGAQWSDHGNSNPFVDITNAVQQQMNNSPMPPNTCWMSIDTWLQIVNHPDFLARLGLAQDRAMSEAKFLSLLAPYGIEKVYIGRVKANGANVSQTASLSSLWPKHFWLGYVTDTPGQDEVNGGYKFYLDGMRQVTREFKNNPPGNELVNRDFYDYELLSPDVYYMLQNVIA